jgi:hypothetical protein
VTLIQEDRGVVRVDAVDREREDARAGPGVRGAQQVHPGLVGERARHAGVDGVLLGLDRIEPDASKVVEAGMRADHPRVVLEARLEPVGGRPQSVGLERRPFHGLASDEQRSEASERFGRGRQHARSGRAEHLVRRDRVEVDPEAVELDLLVGGGLATVEQDERAAVVGSLGDLPDRQCVPVQVGGVE